MIPAGVLIAAALAPPQTVTVDDVLRLLRDNSPRAAAERAPIAVAEAGRAAARVLPNPSLDANVVHLSSGANTGAADTRQFVASQPLLIFGQRAERRRHTDTEVLAAEADADARFAERAREARDRFAALLARQEQAAVLDDERADLERIAEVVTGRAAAGDRSRYDALRIDLELRAREADLSSARAEVDEAAGALATILGIPGWRPRAQGPLQPAGLDVADEDGLWAGAQTRLPALVAAVRAREAAHAAVDLARRERLPVPVLSAGGQFTQDLESTSWVAGLSLPLPIFDRGQGEIARASAQAEAADLELAALQAETRADLHRAVSVLAARRATLDRIERDVMGRLPDLRRMSEDAYREGQADILDLLDAMRSRAAARLSRLDALEAVVHAEIDILALTGAAGAEPSAH